MRPDVNLLFYATLSGMPQHQPALEWWQAALNGDEPIGMAPVVAMGLVRLSTNGRVFDDALTVGAAIDYVQEWVARRSHCRPRLSPR